MASTTLCLAILLVVVFVLAIDARYLLVNIDDRPDTRDPSQFHPSACTRRWGSNRVDPGNPSL